MVSDPRDALTAFFQGTFAPGQEVRIEDADGNEFISSDVVALVDACQTATVDDTWIDLVDAAGDAHGLTLPGDWRVVDPSPSYEIDGGMVYLLANDEVVPGEVQGKHMLPVTAVINCPDPLTYQIAELNITTPGSEMEIILSNGRNRMEGQGKWKAVRSVFGQFSDALQRHTEGKKDGPCFLQGECASGHRKAAAMVANYIIGVDLDSGAPLADVMDSIISAGLEAVIYTTHSHLKDTSQIKKDHFLKWADGEDISEKLIAEYLMQQKGTLPEIVSHIEIIDDSFHTEEGVVILVKHHPMPKFRAVFPLTEPFVFARRGGTQQDAIAEWKERYAGFASKMQFFFDETCVDPARLFYLPRHKAGDVFGSWWVAGKPVNLDDFDRVKIKRGKKGKRLQPQNAFSDFAGDEDDDNDRNRYMVGDFNLMGWAKTSAKLFEIETLIADTAPESIRENRGSSAGVHVECPFEAEHSSFGGGGSFVVNASDNYDSGYDGGFTFKCVHNACAGRDRLDFIKGCIEEEWFTVEDLQKQDYLLELDVEDEPAPDPARKAAAKTPPKAAQKAAQGAYEEPADDGLDEESRLLNAFNKRYAIVVTSGGVKVLREPLLIDEDIQFLTQSDIALLERNKILFVQNKTGKTDRIEAFKAWCEWSSRRTYQAVQFSPGKELGPEIYNLFRGFPYDPIKGDWSLLRGHIFDNICESDEALFDWFMSWMAQLIQQPHRKPGSTLVVTGDKGTGKSTTFDFLGMLLGRHSISVSQRKQIVGNFNAHIATALLMVCEEAFWAADPQAEGVLKDMITSREMLIEKKGYDPIKSENYTRLVLISNSDWVVPASLKDERRFGVFRCSDARRGDIEFFDRLRAQMEYEGGLEAMMYDLLHYLPATGSFGCLFNPPQTKYLQQQQVETLSGVDKFMLDLMKAGGYESTNENIDAIELNQDRETLVYAVNLRACVEDYVRMLFASDKARTSYDDIAVMAMSWFGATEFMLEVDGNTNKKRTFRFPSLNDSRSMLKERKGLDIQVIDIEQAKSRSNRR